MPKGYTHSEETRRKMSEAHKWYRPSEETKRKISEAGRGHPVSEELRAKLRNANLGKRHSEETKNKISDFHKGKKKSKEAIAKRTKSRRENALKRGYFYSPQTRKKMSEAHIGKKIGSFSKEHKEKISRAHQGKTLTQEHINNLKAVRLLRVIPFTDTKIEQVIQEELSARGYAYYCHYAILGQPDIAFPDQKIAIFCDGDYWHANPDIYGAEDLIFKGKTAENIREKDKDISEYLQKKGWLVLRYWETEIKANPEAVVDEIEDVLMVKL